MELFESFKKFSQSIESNLTKIYLIVANIVVVIFAIWFSNKGLLPFANKSDFAFFAILSLILGLYRPGWTFAFFVGTLALENINLVPSGFGISLRPYQFFGFITMISLLVQLASKRLIFPLPRFKFYDALPIVFVISGLIGSAISMNFSVSFKLAVIAISFVAIYFLVRIYIQSVQDLKRILPFFMSGAFVVIIYGIWQNIFFIKGMESFEIMPGRPNSTFSEPDWFGIYLVFVLAAIYSTLYYIKNRSSYSLSRAFDNFSIFQFFNYLFLTLILTVLILTVSRSAWVGAIIVAIGFWKVILCEGSFKISSWKWKSFLNQIVLTILILVISVGVATKLTRFQLLNRAVSTGGLQKITVACPADIDFILPEKISNLDEIKPCRHINLEEIEKEKSRGNFIGEVFRSDPTVNIRADIYRKSISEIKKHPLLGIGWGSISNILGTDERGAGLNASNIFLEIWLGSGFFGFLSIVLLFVCILISAIRKFFNNRINDKTFIIFILLGWTAVIIPNLFNSGIFLGFVWVYLGAAVSILQESCERS